MPDRSWKGKGEAVPRRSPRKRGKTCGRPFKAPRPVKETEKEIITDSDKEEIIERGEYKTIELDTTGSTPDCCKSPDMGPVRMTGEIVQVAPFEIEARQHKRKFNYEGVSLVKETEVQDSDADSEDNVPIATVLTKKIKRRIYILS